MEEIEEKLGPLRQKLIAKLADIAYAAAFFGAPWKSGYLAQSIVKEVGINEATIEALAPYAGFVEKGTAPHEIRPMRAQALRFEVAGQVVFAKLVRHPGTKPNPFMQRAADETVSQVPRVFRDLCEEDLE